LDVYDGPGRDELLTDQIDFARRAVGPMSPAAKTDAV
jgi:hypothetical protein